MRTRTWLALGLVALVLGTAAAAPLLAQGYVRRYVREQAVPRVSQRLGHPITVRSASGPLGLLQLEELTLFEPSGDPAAKDGAKGPPIARIARVEVAYRVDFWKRSAELDRISVEGLDLQVRRESGHDNLRPLLDALRRRGGGPGPGGGRVRLAQGAVLEVKSGQLHVQNDGKELASAGQLAIASAGQKRFNVTLGKLNVAGVEGVQLAIDQVKVKLSRDGAWKLDDVEVLRPTAQVARRKALRGLLDRVGLKRKKKVADEEGGGSDDPAAAAEPGSETAAKDPAAAPKDPAAAAKDPAAADGGAAAAGAPPARADDAAAPAGLPAGLFPPPGRWRITGGTIRMGARANAIDLTGLAAEYDGTDPTNLRASVEAAIEQPPAQPGGPSPAAGELKARVSFKPLDKALDAHLQIDPIPLRLFASKLEEYAVAADRARMRLTTDLSLSQEGISARGQLRVAALDVAHAALTTQVLEGLGLSLDFDVKSDRARTRVDWKSTMHLAEGVSVAFNAVADRLDDQPRVAVRVKLDPTTCQQVLAALPVAFVPRLEGMQTKGKLSFWLNAAIDLKRVFAKDPPPDLKGLSPAARKKAEEDDPSFKMDGQVNRTACKVLRDGRAQVEATEKPFTHEFEERAYDKEGKSQLDKPRVLRSLVIGPDSPDFATLDEIPKPLINSFISREDGTFFRHKGFNFSEIKKAIVYDLQQGYFARGASTISQQVVKNVFLSRDKTFGRKLEELILTWRMEQVLTKERILEIYLNVIEMGPGLYGVRQAARHYFGKEVEKLNPLECAFLSTLAPGPRKFFLKLKKKERTGETHAEVPEWMLKKAQRTVTLMHSRELLSAELAEKFKDEKLELREGAHRPPPFRPEPTQGAWDPEWRRRKDEEKERQKQAEAAAAVAGAPGAPGAPAAPGTPATPGAPVAPAIPGAPATAGAPALTRAPGAPVAPGVVSSPPGTPGAPTVRPAGTAGPLAPAIPGAAVPLTPTKPVPSLRPGQRPTRPASPLLRPGEEAPPPPKKKRG